MSFILNKLRKTAKAVWFTHNSTHWCATDKQWSLLKLVSQNKLQNVLIRRDRAGDKFDLYSFWWFSDSSQTVWDYQRDLRFNNAPWSSLALSFLLLLSWIAYKIVTFVYIVKAVYLQKILWPNTPQMYKNNIFFSSNTAIYFSAIIWWWWWSGSHFNFYYTGDWLVNKSKEMSIYQKNIAMVLFCLNYVL